MKPKLGIPKGVQPTPLVIGVDSIMQWSHRTTHPISTSPPSPYLCARVKSVLVAWDGEVIFIAHASRLS